MYVVAWVECPEDFRVDGFRSQTLLAPGQQSVVNRGLQMQKARDLRRGSRSAGRKLRGVSVSTDQPCINKREVHRIAQNFSFLPLASRSFDYFPTNFRSIFYVDEEADRGLKVKPRVIVDFHQPVTF